MLRKIHVLLLVMSCFIGAVAFAGALLCEIETIEEIRIRPTINYTDEMIVEQPYFDLVAAKGENKNLVCDIDSYSLGDGYIHLYLPKDVPDNSVVVYIRDIEGNYLARRVYDFGKEVKIGSWKVSIEHHNLPTMYFVSDESDVFETMNNMTKMNIVCDGELFLDCGETQQKMEKKSIRSTLKLRGNSSREWTENKKSYTLRLNNSKDLFGMGKNKSWNLIGNAFDRSLMKNIVFNSISEEIGIRYQPQIQSVNLYIDGVYQGVYTLTTKVKAGERRIPLAKGDYLFKMDPPHQEQPILYESGDWHKDDVNPPVADLIYPQNASEESLQKAQFELQRFIDSIKDPSWEVMTDICDMDSLARYYWIQEVSMNYDSWDRSVYMYYLKNDKKIHMGPVWDMDLTLGYLFNRYGLKFDKPEGWITREHGWYDKLFEDKEFRRTVRDVYFNGGVRDAFIDGIEDFINSREQLGEDAYYNFLMYGYSNRGYTLNYGDTYDEYCDNMIEFYKKRLAWIDTMMNASENM